MLHFKKLSEGSEVEVKNSTVVWKFGNMNKVLLWFNKGICLDIVKRTYKIALSLYWII
jgi:hypothetical protein